MHSRWTCARTEVPARLIFESDFRPVHRCPRAGGRTKKADESNRDAACQRGICPAIPYRSNTKDIPAFSRGSLQGARPFEQAVGKLKRFERSALRCEKTAQNYGSFVALALGIILIKSVRTA